MAGPDEPAASSASAAAELVVSEETTAAVERARRSVSALMGHTNSKFSLVEGHWKALSDAVGDADPNPSAVHTQSVFLQKGLESLLAQLERYQVGVDNYVSLSEGTNEPLQTRFNNTKTARDELVQKVLKLQKDAVATMCQGPQVTISASSQASLKAVKPEKELKPDHRLEEGDSLDTFNTWFTQFRTYFNRSHFDQATPEEQRVFMSKCMDNALWKRVSGGETTAERALPIDPSVTTTGIFQVLQTVFGLKDPLLLKRLELFTQQKFESQQYESFSTYMARRQLLKAEADFYSMKLDDVELCWAFQGIRDPKLRKKILALEDPNLESFTQEGRKFELLARKLGKDQENRDKENPTAGGVNAVDTARPANTRYCRLCSKACPSKYNICNSCFQAKQKRLQEQGAQAGSSAPASGQRGRGGGGATRGGARGRGRSSGRGPRGARGGRSRPRGRGFSRFSGRAQNPLFAGNSQRVSNILGYEHEGEEEQEYNESEEYYEEDYGSYDYDLEEPEEDYEGVNSVSVLTSQLSKSQLSASCVTAVYKVDGTTYIHGNVEFAWRLKEIARNKHRKNSKVRSDNHTNALSTLSYISMLAIFLGEILVKPFLDHCRPLLGLLTNLMWGYKMMILVVHTMFKSLDNKNSFFDNHFLMHNVGTISCSQVGTGTDDFTMPVSDTEQRKALMSIQSSISKGKKINLDNMACTVGNSRAEGQQRSRTRAHVLACPDTGASRSLCGISLAKRLGCKIHRERISIRNASGAKMSYSGTAFFKVTFEDQEIHVPVLLSPDVEGRLILGRIDLVAMHVISPRFPQVLPPKIFKALQ